MLSMTQAIEDVRPTKYGKKPDPVRHTRLGPVLDEVDERGTAAPSGERLTT